MAYVYIKTFLTIFPTLLCYDTHSQYVFGATAMNPCLARADMSKCLEDHLRPTRWQCGVMSLFPHYWQQENRIPDMRKRSQPKRTLQPLCSKSKQKKEGRTKEEQEEEGSQSKSHDSGDSVVVLKRFFKTQGFEVLRLKMKRELKRDQSLWDQNWSLEVKEKTHLKVEKKHTDNETMLK